MAVSRYSVIRYMPDPRREEHINIGVIVATDDGSFVDARFTSNWSRVQHFGQENLEFLKEFARLVRYSISQGQQSLFAPTRLDAEALTRFAADWHNSIQFTPPRASVAPDPRRLLVQLFATYVVEARPSKPQPRTKQEIVNLTKTQFEAAIRYEFTHDAPRVVKDDLLMGAAAIHDFDLVVRNGVPYVGIEGVSFDRILSEDLQQTVQSMAFVLEDVRDANPDLPLAVVAIPPSRPRTDYERALRIYEKVRVPVIVESGLEDWVSHTVREFSARRATTGIEPAGEQS